MSLLVTTSRSLLLLDTDSGTLRPLHRGAGLYYGIAATPRHYLVAARRRMVSSSEPAAAERGEILVFDRHFQPVDTWLAPFPLRDIHEIAWHRRHLWVTCSHDNMLAIRAPDGRWDAWYPLGEPAGEPRDINHFNSLRLAGNDLWLLAHNRGPSEILHFDIARRRLLARHPLGQQAHNVWRHAGQWCTCSSGEGALRGSAGFSVTTGGFPRGVARLPGGWAVGVSGLAERSRRDLTDGHVILFDRHWRETRRLPLPGEGLVLDLLPAGGPLGGFFFRWPLAVLRRALRQANR